MLDSRCWVVRINWVIEVSLQKQSVEESTSDS